MNKIDTIIDALEQADRMRRKQGYTEEYLQEALAAARELRDMKPVAWTRKETIDWITSNKRSESAYATINVYRCKQPDYDAPLYTAPPRKPWVGLTDEEISDLYYASKYGSEEYDGGASEFARAIEAKLKELNT